MPADIIEEMRKALKAAQNTSEIVVYPDAPHAFHADYRPSYGKDAAEDGWKRLQAGSGSMAPRFAGTQGTSLFRANNPPDGSRYRGLQIDRLHPCTLAPRHLEK